MNNNIITYIQNVDGITIRDIVNYANEHPEILDKKLSFNAVEDYSDWWRTVIEIVGNDNSKDFICLRDWLD